MSEESEDFDLSEITKPKSDQLNADDLIGGPITITVRRVKRGDSEQKMWIYYEGDEGKPFKPCLSMIRVIMAAWGKSAKACVGRSMTLYRDPKAKWSGQEVGGVRISHMSHIDSDMRIVITESKTKRAPFTVRRLQSKPDPQADHSAAVDSALRAIAAADGSAGVDAVESALKESAADWGKAEKRKVWDAIKARRGELGGGE